MRRYGVTLIALWVVGSAAAFFYSREKGFPPEVAVPVAAAMLLELSLYAGLAFPAVRRRAESAGTRLAWWLVASALVPYLVQALAPGAFRWEALVSLGVLAATASFWYVLLPHRRVVDAGFLVLLASAYLARVSEDHRVFQAIYPRPVEGMRIDVLGQLMWFRLGVSAVLLLRRMEGIGFGFWPTREEWRIGLFNYALFLPAGVLLTHTLGFARFGPTGRSLWEGAATFFGALWVVALSEELFFRGMLQRWLVDGLGVRTGVLVTAVVFGAAHLGFRRFPNWEFATLATLAGIFYGRAYLQGNGIRAGMVTHALVVATWRGLFH